MFIVKRIFKYFEPMWTGDDHRISLRSVLAIAFSIDFMRNLTHAIWKWEIGRSLEGLSLVLGIEAGLIVALLGLKTYQNMTVLNKDTSGTDTKVTTDNETSTTTVTVEQPGNIR